MGARQRRRSSRPVVAPRRSATPSRPTARPHRRLSRWGKVAPLVALVALLAGLAIAAPRHPQEAEGVSTPALPFDMPSTAELRASPHKVFVNYFTPLPISVDNRPADSDYYARNYLTPDGENSEHAAYGGLLRDRPLPRAPLDDPEWRLRDLETEVRQAAAAGIDGFYLDMLQLEGDPDVRVWQTTQLMMQAAAQADPGFKIILMPDLTGAMKDKSVATLAKYTAQLGASPSAQRLADGRLVVMPSAAEAHPVAWWQDFLDTMANQYQMPVALVPIFIASEVDYRDAFAPISYAMSIWGAGNPEWNDPTTTYPTSPRGRAAAVHALDKLWVQPVRVQDERPNQGLFSEAENTTNLRNTWQLARETNADWVQIPTWNDYSEGAQLAPSVEHGYSFLDINSYYLTWFKTGSPPRIVRDTVYLTHRKQPWAALPQYPETKLMNLRGGSPARDTVEALTFLTAPATVTISTGGRKSSCEVPAGVGVCTVPLGLGTVSASVVRQSATVAAVTSPYVVTDSPEVQDLQYVAVSSRRLSPTPLGATTGGAGAPQATDPRSSVASPSPAEPGDDVVSVTPDLDTYVNQGARETRYADQTSLASRGHPGYISYLRFTLPPAPDDKRLVRAQLQVTTTSHDFAGSADPHSVQLLARSAKVSAKTHWTTRPALSGSRVGFFDGPIKPESTIRAELDVNRLADALGKDGVFAVASSGTDNLWFASSESGGSRQPELRLTFR